MPKKKQKLDDKKNLDPKNIVTEYSPIKAAPAGRPKNPPSPKKMLKEIIPIGDIFEERELTIYNSLVDSYIKDFDEDELSYGDVDDIMTLAMNKVFEIRLLSTSRGNANKLMDISRSIEAIKKQSEKIKENLALRRKDRINPNEFKGFSIVDLAVAFDNEKRGHLAEKIKQMKVEQEVAKKELADHPGSRYDMDGDVKQDAE
jgi:hypothetical protein